MPKQSDIDVKGIKISDDQMKSLLSVDVEGWKKDMQELKEYYKLFGKKMPSELKNNLEKIEKNLS